MVQLRNDKGIGELLHLSGEWLDEQFFSEMNGLAEQFETGIADHTVAFVKIFKKTNPGIRS